MRWYEVSSASSLSWNPSPPPPFSITDDPTFDVRMMSVFLNEITRPLESVNRPSSRICNIMLNTSGCAFSISSRSKTPNGLRRTASVRVPPCPNPAYPGGAPISLETLCRSMYSDMSSRVMLSWLPKKRSANALTSSVLPTPVGPANKSDAIGRSALFKPHRARRIARVTAPTASAWPTTSFERVPAMLVNTPDSCCVIFCTGTPDQQLAMCSISETPTTRFSWEMDPEATPFATSAFVTSISRARNRDASSKFSSLILSSFIVRTSFSWRHWSICSMDTASSVAPAFWSDSLISKYRSIRALLPASSIKSRALSGRNRSGMYRDEIFTAASRASSVY
mmetsp:Transcript_1043/g.3424  ORF Transcript_1043/g.3424 Transcript_1043/m.3424 type:complete len:338 (+) Transcript_1043:653-1666(+)